MSEKLKVKDLILIGVFTVIYMITMFVVGIIGFVPILYLFWPALAALVCGMIVMLFMAKVPRPFAMFIFALLPSLLFFAMGLPVLYIINGLIIAIIAELLLKLGGYKKFIFNALAYAVFSLSNCTMIVQWLISKAAVYKKTVEVYGAEYAEKLDSLITVVNVSGIFILTFVMALIGAYIGKLVLKKHFEKAGIV